MGRFKTQHWSVTYSPSEDVTEESIPDEFRNFVDRFDVERAIVVLEHHGNEKWHLHAAISLSREYVSDYTKWFPIEHGGPKDGKPWCVVASRDILQLAGGYLAKEGDTRLVYRRGYTDQQLEAGKR